ncbi:MAG TPA: Mur ligase family protein [Gaiellaceae bacterium]|nr:Mur ligase family protein [Gaiellaceae bacterium]
MPSAVEWLESLSPWPTDGFGLERMHALLAELGDPQLSFPAVHVVGTKGKSTTTRTIEETLLREGLLAGAYTSPHVSGWAERIRVGGAEIDVEQGLAGVRPRADPLGATQFETLTAAALLAFAEAGVDAAAVEAGLGGRCDATNVLRSPVQVLTNVALEHTEVLGDTREAIAAEKLAVVQAGSTVVLGEPEWEQLARTNGAAHVIVETGGNRALAGAAAGAFLGRPVEPAEAHLAGRLDVRGDEIWDGAHTPDAVRHIAPSLPPLGSIVASLLADKDVDGVLAELAKTASILVATSSSNPRALSADKLAGCARPHFAHVEAVEDPRRALLRAHDLGEPVLVTGSLYLLADLWPTAARA